MAVVAEEAFHAEGVEVAGANDQSERVSPPLLVSTATSPTSIHTSLVIQSIATGTNVLGLNTYPLCSGVMTPVPPPLRRQVQPRKHGPQPVHSRVVTQH